MITRHLLWIINKLALNYKFIKEAHLTLKNYPNQTVIFIMLAATLIANTALAADDLAVRRYRANVDNANDSIVPVAISDAVSDVDMQLRLAAKPNAASCVADNCLQNQVFDARVQQLGTQLSAAAYAQYPALKKRVANFAFSVANKKEAGSASNAGGKVVLFRGLQQFVLSDDALSFIMAREMAHIVAKHHNKNTSTKLIISALATILFPAVGIIGASSAATQATTATTLLTSAASTATSMLGSEVALAKMKPSQLLEADEIAVKVLGQRDWNLRETAGVLQLDEPESAANNWLQDLQTSQHYLQQLVNIEDNAIVALATDQMEADQIVADQVEASNDPPAPDTTVKLEAAK